MLVEINGVPLHPLVVHAAVVLAPAAALMSVLVLNARWRWLTRWPALLLTLGAALSVQLAALTGEDLKAQLGDNPLIRTHETWAGRLQVATWVLLAVTAVAFWALPAVSRLQGGRDRPGRVAVLEKPLLVLLPVVAVVVLVLVVLTGDAGARAVWTAAR